MLRRKNARRSLSAGNCRDTFESLIIASSHCTFAEKRLASFKSSQPYLLEHSRRGIRSTRLKRTPDARPQGASFMGSIVFSAAS